VRSLEDQDGELGESEQDEDPELGVEQDVVV